MLITYPLDLTGLLETNAIVNELHTITAVNDRHYQFIVPIFTPFFANSLTINFLAGQETRQLIRGIDYSMAVPFIGASRAANQYLYGAISLINPGYIGTISINYQTLGGPWSYNRAFILRTFAEAIYNNRTITWETIFNIPNCFPSTRHQQDAGAFYGQDRLIDSIENFKNIIAQTATNRDIDRHLGNLQNPHQLTIQSIGYFPCLIEDIMSGQINDGILTLDGAYLILSGVGGHGYGLNQIKIKTPIIVVPNSPIVSSSTYMNFNSSAFSTISEVDTHLSSSWQLSTDSSFTNIVQQTLNDTVNKTEWSVSNLTPGEIYYVRVMHKGHSHGNSLWSLTLTVSELIIQVNRPFIFYPANESASHEAPLQVSSSRLIMSYGSDKHESTDWQVATDINFLNITQESVADVVNKITWTINEVQPGRTYYVRVRYKSQNHGKSDWSYLVAFSGISISVNQPIILNPTNLQNNVYPNTAMISSEMSLNYGIDEHISSSWQVSTDENFSSVTQQSIDNQINKTQLDFANLVSGQTYFVRVKHTSNLYGDSQWSNVVSFTVLTIHVEKPTTAFPVNEAIKQPVILIADSSAFGVNYGTDTHLSSNWQLSNDPSFSTIISQSLYNTVNLTSWPISGLLFNTTYYIRVCHTGAIRGTSEWSVPILFTTMQQTYPKNEVLKLVASDWCGYDCFASNYSGSSISFGSPIAISDDGIFMIMGAYSNSNSGKLNVGAAYIFKKDGSTWSEQAKLIASDGITLDCFGFSVAMSGDGSVVAIGSYSNDNSSGANSGAVYIFKQINNVWSQQVKLISENIWNNDNFGYSLAMSSDGNTLAVSSINYYDTNNPSITSHGAVYVFINSGLSWSQEAKLLASDKASTDRFGNSISMSSDGNLILIGAKLDNNERGSDCGSAYIFRKTQSTWSQEKKLIASDGASYDWFGSSVALSKNGLFALIGAPKNTNAKGSEAGAAYIFINSGNDWTLQQKLIPDTIGVKSYAGSVVTIDQVGQVAVIGACYDTNSRGTQVGDAFVFTRTGNSWNEKGSLVPGNSNGYAHFANSAQLSYDGSFVVIGARETYENTLAVGSAYIFDQLMF
jgi:hypothetical protein